MQIDENIGVEIDEETVEIGVFNESDKTVSTELGDIEVDSLHRKSQEKDLLLQPSFQRLYVWDIKKASKLIESVLLKVPLPIVYISQEQDDKEYVIDGQQRLTSLFSFIDGKLPDGKEFSLQELNVLPELNGKNYGQLTKEQQKKIRFYKIRVITFLKNSSDNLKFEIFERLNTGSEPLNDQELRNCIYRGKLNDALKEMAAEPDFMELCGFKSPDLRMRDKELVLRFCAFYHKTYLNYKAPIKNFLNAEAKEKNNISDAELNELRKSFKNSCSIIKSLFGKNAFKRYYKGSDDSPNGYWESKKFNQSLYDILMDSFSRVDKNLVHQNLDSIRESFIYLMSEDEDFINAIERSTSSQNAITVRFDKWRAMLQSVLGYTKKEERCFSRTLKEQLFQLNPDCKICNQRIQSVDDAAVDHIKQYWTGGRTIPENARLTHRYCNCARSRND